MRARRAMGVSVLVMAVGLIGLTLVGPTPGSAATNDADQVLLVEPNGRWHVRVPGQADYTFWYGMAGDTPLLGDWDGDGFDTPGMYRPSNGFAYLTNDLPPNGVVGFGDPALTFFFGIPGDKVFVGDWDNDGVDTLGIGRNGRMFLSNTNATVFADQDFWFGTPTDTPFGGNPDNNWGDSVFLFRPATGFVYYNVFNPTGSGSVSATEGDFFYGIPGDRLVVGDWDGDGTDTAGIFRPAERIVYLRNTLNTGSADTSYQWGQSSWMPVAGRVEVVPPNTTTTSPPTTTTLPPTTTTTVPSTSCTVPSATHPSIQSALDNPACLEVLIGAGTFYENLTVDRDVSLQGVGTHLTAINGLGSTVIIVEGNADADLSIKGVTVTGGTDGLHIQASGWHGVTLTESQIIDNTGDGIDIGGGGAGVALTLADSQITRNGGSGISATRSLATQTITVAESTISENDGSGIYIRYGTLTVTGSILDHNGASGINGVSTVVAVADSNIHNNTGSLSDGWGPFPPPLGTSGGGVYGVDATLTVSNSHIWGNTADNGGGIYTNGGVLNVTDSTISVNTADNGGGIRASSTETVITDSTISRNSENGIGMSSGELHVTRSTVSDNLGVGLSMFGGVLTVTDSIIRDNDDRGIESVWLSTTTVHTSMISGNASGGIYAEMGVSVLVSDTTIANNGGTGITTTEDLGGGGVTVVNSTISGNGFGIMIADYATGSVMSSTITGNGIGFGPTGASGAITNSIIHVPCDDWVPTLWASGGHNVASDCDLIAPDPTDVIGDPLLGPLADNGGPTLTHKPQPGSPAIDLIPPADCSLDVDQRGVARPQGAGCDAGAVEAE